MRAAIALAVLVGCAPALPPPEGAARAYADAAIGKDARAAYGLMSARFRGQVPFARFEPGLGAYAPTTTAQLRDCRVEWRAVVDEDGPAELHLVQEDAGWRIDQDPTQVYPQRTAREAARSFARALGRGRLERAAALLCSSLRAALTPSALAERLAAASSGGAVGIGQEARAHLDELRAEGDSVVLPLGPVTELKLRREDGAFCIEVLP